MAMQYLTLDEALALHKYSVERFGGSSDLLNRGKLEALLAAPMQNVFDTELYPDVWSTAAILAFSLIKNHAFIDGNKPPPLTFAHVATILIPSFLKFSPAVFQTGEAFHLSN